AEIPMNGGCLRPINIIIPKQSMLSPIYPAAVVAGNVETSQAVTTCLFGALGALPAAQGSMHDLNSGNDTYQYYETIRSASAAARPVRSAKMPCAAKTAGSRSFRAPTPP